MVRSISLALTSKKPGRQKGLPHKVSRLTALELRAAQHAADHGMLEEQIQELGRWSSQAFKL